MTANIYRSALDFRIAIAQAIGRYHATPHIITNWRLWALRRALMPYVILQFWAISHQHSRFFLSKDRVDDLILEDIIKKFSTLYFPDEMLFLGNLLILDIGAHHGFYAVETLRRNPQAHLIAVEPNPSALGLLKKNLAANNALDRVEIVHAGIGSYDGHALLEHSSNGSWSRRTIAMDPNNPQDNQICLRTAATILQGRKPNVIKCNAEGAEFELFPQLFLLDIYPPVVILMAHPEYGDVDSLLNLFRKKNYRVRDAGSTQKRIRLHCLHE